MAQQALVSGIFPVVMVAHHMLHQAARWRVLTPARERGVGTLIMFAVRRIFKSPENLARAVAELIRNGRLPSKIDGAHSPLDFLVHRSWARNIVDAAYRYCRHTPGTDVVLTGTGNLRHLRDNVTSIYRLQTPHLRNAGLDRPASTTDSPPPECTS